MPDELEDDLLERFVRGDQHAFESLSRQFEAEVYRWVLQVVRGERGRGCPRRSLLAGLPSLTRSAAAPHRIPEPRSCVPT